MKSLVFLSLMAILATGCTAQDKKSTDLAHNGDPAVDKAPKGKWEVRKEMDENGNLVRYDSIYTWSSDDNYAQLKEKNMDSIMNSFSSMFQQHFGNMQGMEFPKDLEQDSLFTKDFFNFNDDFFAQHFGNGTIDMEAVRKHMADLQNEFMKQFPSEMDDSQDSKKSSDGDSN